MRTIKIALYKKSKTLFGKGIRIKQNLQGFSGRYSQYSHTELVFDNGLSFSSSEVDGGVRFKKIKFKKKHWDFIEIQVSDYNYKKVLSFCEKQDGNKYNFTGIVFAQIFNMNIKKEGDWFCSEIVSRALQEVSLLCPYSSLFINPARLANLLENKGFYINKKI